MHTGIGLLLSVLGTAARAEAPAPCAEPVVPLACPPAAPPLPRGDNYWRRWHQATTEAMSGRRASVLYREPSATMDAYWRLAAFDRQQPWLDERDAVRAREAAQLGVLSGLEATLRDTFERSEALAVLYRVGSTASGANVEWTGRRREDPGGSQPDRSPGPRLRYNAQPAGLQAARASLDDDIRPAVGPSRARGRAGVAVQLVDGAAAEEVWDPDLALTGYVELRSLGPDLVRAELSRPLPPGPTERRAEDSDGPEGSWTTSLRQGLVPSIDLVARVQGSQALSWSPERATGGLALRLPTRQAWTTRLELSRAFPYASTPQREEAIPGEWRVGLTPGG